MTAMLLFLAPLLELLLLGYPPIPDDPIWRLAIAQALPGTLMVPAAGSLVLAVLAVSRPSPLSTGLALSTCAFGAALAGFAFGVLLSEALPFGPLPQGSTVSVTWPIAQATLTVVVFGVIGWGVYRHGHLGAIVHGGAALPTPRPIGIDLLE